MKLHLEFITIVVFINSFLHAKAFRIRRNAIKDENRRWPLGIVPTVISNSFSDSEKRVIIGAMGLISSASCVIFVHRDDRKGYLDVVKGDGCNAHVGYSENARRMTLGSGCVTTTVVLHELFHILGFDHEHARPDRDQYVRVLHHNVKPGDLDAFDKTSWDTYTAFGLPYDYNSIMHYKDTDFAKDGSRKSLESIHGYRVLGRAPGMSELDKRKLNKLYWCSEKGTARQKCMTVEGHWWCRDM